MINCLNDLCKSIMMIMIDSNVLFFTFINKMLVAMPCYEYCVLMRVVAVLTGACLNQNSKIWPTI